MNNPLAVLRLLLGLITVLIFLPVFVRTLPSRDDECPVASQKAHGSTTVLLAAIGTVPAVAWIAVPELFEVASLPLPLVVRQLGLLAGGGGVLVVYLRTRAEAIGGEPSWTTALGRFAPLFYAIGVVLIAANWLVGAAAVLAGALFALKPPAGWSWPPDRRP